MKQKYFHTQIVFLAVLIAVISAVPAIATSDCDISQKTIETDLSDWLIFAEKIKPRIEEHSMNNLKILGFKIKIMNLRGEAVAAVTYDERRLLIEEYKALEQELYEIELDEPRKTYYQDWEKLMIDQEKLVSNISVHYDKCPAYDPRGN